LSYPPAQLADRAAITEIIVSLARAQDDRDWDRFGRIFTREVKLDLSAHSGQPARVVSVEELAEGARQALEGFEWTEHSTSNIWIELDGERARCRTYVRAHHHLATTPGAVDFCSLRGRWDQRLVRAEGRWRIAEWTVGRVGPVDGDEELYRIAASRVAGSDPRKRGEHQPDMPR